MKGAMLGAMYSMNEPQREFVLEVVAAFHVRDGAKNADGSWGTIRISPDQLRDAIAYALTKGPRA